jgi:hypothetical protein
MITNYVCKKIFLTAYLFFAIHLLALSAYVPLKTSDVVYEPNIYSVQLYLGNGNFDQQFTQPVIAIQQSDSLKLSFDELRVNSSQTYFFKIIHCQSDWSVSSLLESEYLQDFVNLNLITNYTLSNNTKVNYIHYACLLPKVKITGNFLVLVFRDRDEKDIILSKRFMVFDNKLNIIPDLKVSTGIEERFTHQQIDFSIDYTRYPYIFNPIEEIRVLIRQNGRWDNAIYALKPFAIKSAENILDYHFFNFENNFAGGNEFRVFDARRIRTYGLNTSKIQFLDTIINLRINTDVSRNGSKYIYYVDANGRYWLGNNEVGGNYGDPDYVNVIFTFKTAEMPSGNIHVLGGFNNYEVNEKSKMNYDPFTETYQCKYLLKQGYYNYIFGVKSYADSKINDTELEGSFFSTENQYEIFVYHRPQGSRADILIGYLNVNFNGQR